jgi:hypothetical protein
VNLPVLIAPRDAALVHRQSMLTTYLRQRILTAMSEQNEARGVVEQYLQAAQGSGPLGIVRASAALAREVDRQQREAVRRATEQHSWAEIGTALGVSKQAAHHKFVAGLAEALKAQSQEMKDALRAGRPDDAATTRGSMKSTAGLMRKAHRLS